MQERCGWEDLARSETSLGGGVEAPSGREWSATVASITFVCSGQARSGLPGGSPCIVPSLKWTTPSAAKCERVLHRGLQSNTNIAKGQRKRMGIKAQRRQRRQQNSTSHATSRLGSKTTSAGEHETAATASLCQMEAALCHLGASVALPSASSSASRCSCRAA